jgi:hypothetical protein
MLHFILLRKRGRGEERRGEERKGKEVDCKGVTTVMEDPP